MTGLTEQQLAEIAARANAATPGPWCTDDWEIYQGTEYTPGISEWIGETCRGKTAFEQDRADAAFIAAARTDVPVLLDHVTTLEQQRERRRVRLIALQNDALDMRGALSPNGQACKVPMPLGETLLPAVEWLISRVEELERAAARDVTVYRASHDSIVIGHYRTAQVAREHCESFIRRENPRAVLDWIANEDDELSPAELAEQVGDDESLTGFVVTPVSVTAAFDADGDE